MKCRYDLSEDCHKKDCLDCVLDKMRVELHATAEMHENGHYYLREKWIDEILDKYKAEGSDRE